MSGTINAVEANAVRDFVSGRITRIKVKNDGGAIVYDQPIASKVVLDRKIELTQLIGTAEANDHFLQSAEVWTSGGNWWAYENVNIDRRAGSPYYGVQITLNFTLSF